VPFSIVLSDIDGFKSFNDRYRHDCGDFILRKLADLMRSKLRKQDTISRWGGEEFLILVPETAIEGARTLSEKIRKSVERGKFIFNGKKLSLTLTLGVCMFESGMELGECLKRADEALYRGKKSGKNRVVT
jgi:diguanylate cyclase (GGDEF)-like protein